MYKVYKIGMGDTLEKIAGMFNTTAENIKKLNGIQDGMVLGANGFLIVPFTDGVSDNSNFESYIVKKGDNMYSIARTNGVDYKTLLEINGLEASDYIYPGQEIILPRNNTKMYVTEEGDSIESISNKLGIPFNQIKANSGEIYLMPNQLLIYR